MFALFGCNQPVHTLQSAARQEVFTTATCAAVDVSHVPSSDVPEYREDVYVAEGCGMRWRMACGSKYVTRCRRHTNHCSTKLEWECNDIQPEGPDVSDEELRTRVVRPDDMNVLGS
jgi:hypothetical protein